MDIVVTIVLGTLALYLFGGLKVLREYERAVYFFLGRSWGAKGPGLIYVPPLFAKTQTVSLRVVALDIPPQDVITRDNISIKVNAVLYMRVREPVKAVIGVENYLYATSQLAQTTLRSVLGKTELDELREDQQHPEEHHRQARRGLGDRGLSGRSEGRGPAARDEARDCATGRGGAGAPGQGHQCGGRAAGVGEARPGRAHHRLGARRHPAALPADGDGDLLREQLDDVLPDPHRPPQGILRSGNPETGDARAPRTDLGRHRPGRAGEDEGQGVTMAGELIRREALERIIQRAAELQAGEQDIGEGLTEPELLALGQDVGIPSRYLRQALLEEQTRPPAEAR